ncbi:MAG: hypothetical protein EOP62_22490 [Sphingomonadales bacterium]|nr:MAG: hypothetical protein EOP62_22490 [Sphingomonadales bacterium]
MNRLQGMIALAGLTLAAPASAQDAGLGWLVGKWCAEPSASGRVTCEQWQPMAGGVMQGKSTTQHAGLYTVEPMTITVEPGRLVYHAEPPKQAPTDFYAVAAEGQAVRFENKAHDYPQVVRYWREGELLMAEISLADGSKPMRWVYRRED